ncbi:tail fiber domain-containing protein [Candidatus Acetothermia bacterium]|nr:tail fiber domain-containing protein [Candidatus Acetothermia bacterium]
MTKQRITVKKLIWAFLLSTTIGSFLSVPVAFADPVQLNVLVEEQASGFHFSIQVDHVTSTRVEIIGLDGRTLFDSGWIAGPTVAWPMITQTGRPTANGVYLYSVSVRDQQGRERRQLGKLVLVYGQEPVWSGTTVGDLAGTEPAAVQFPLKAGTSWSQRLGVDLSDTYRILRRPARAPGGPVTSFEQLLLLGADGKLHIKELCLGTAFAPVTTQNPDNLTSEGDCRSSWPGPGVGGGTSSGWTDDGTIVRLSTATDNVGVGTTSPGSKFTVAGSETTTHGKNAAVQITNTATGGANWYFRVGATGTGTPAGGLSIANDQFYWLFIANTGNIGIGKNVFNPGSTLTVAGVIESTSGGIKFPDGTIQTTAAGGGGGGASSGWVDDGTIVRLATATDKVGVGTANPTVPLHVVGPSVGQVGIQFDGNDHDFASIYVNAQATTAMPGFGYVRGGILKASTGVDAAGNWFIGVPSSSSARFLVTPAGKVGIGTSSPCPSVMLHVFAGASGFGCTGAIAAVLGEHNGGVGVAGISSGLQGIGVYGATLGSGVGVSGFSSGGFAGDFDSENTGNSFVDVLRVQGFVAGQSGELHLGLNNNFMGGVNYITTCNFQCSASRALEIAGPGNAPADVIVTGRVNIAGQSNWDLNATEGDFRVGDSTHRFKLGVALGGAGGGDVWMRVQGGTNRLFLWASGGTTLFTNDAKTAGVSVAAGGGSWSSVSDRNAKANLHSVDGRAILAKLANIPISTWNYKSQDPSIRHLGPMAQDFYAAFGLGEDEKHITTIDADGISLVSIQALYKMSLERDKEIEELRQELDKKGQEIQELQQQLQQVLHQVQELKTTQKIASSK